jgi:hypothetical protein
MTEETEIAFDLFSTSYVRVPKVTEREKREAAEKRLRAALAMGDVYLEFSMEMMKPFLDQIEKEIEYAFFYGSPAPFHKADYIVIDDYGLPPRVFIEYKEPNFGPPPAAKPDQPRYWVAMNQAPKRPRK